MSVEKFELVVKKLKAEGYNKIGVFNWTEPFLNRTLEHYVALIRANGLVCHLSTTLSLRHIDNLEEVIVAGVDYMIVSMSGIAQATYEVNHVGGKLEYVFANLERIREILDRNLSTTIVVLRFIRFDYNAGEADDLRAYAGGMGFYFEIIEGSGHPYKTGSERASTPQAFEDEIAKSGPSLPPEANGQVSSLNKTGSVRASTPQAFEDEIAKSGSSLPPEANGQVCSLMFDQITIDCEADLYLCCAFPNYAPLKIGKYLDLPEEEILARRYSHPFCRVCTIPRRNATEDDRRRLMAAFGGRIARNIAATANQQPPPRRRLSLFFTSRLSDAVRLTRRSFKTR
jgi:hypothetical protein